VESRLAAMEGGYSGQSGLRRWWDDVIETMPDYRVEIVEVRDFGDAIVARVQGSGSGVTAGAPIVDPFWQVVRLGRAAARGLAQLLQRGRRARSARADQLVETAMRSSACLRVIFPWCVTPTG
jgi:hypothetical protein